LARDAAEIVPLSLVLKTADDGWGNPNGFIKTSDGQEIYVVAGASAIELKRGLERAAAAASRSHTTAKDEASASRQNRTHNHDLRLSAL
jgi:hypothetical protein